MNSAFEKELAKLLTHFLGKRLCSGYLIGSSARNTDSESSDIDLVVVVYGSVTPDDVQACTLIVEKFGSMRRKQLEITLKGFLNITRVGCEQVKLGGRYLVGEKIRSIVPLPDIDKYIARVTASTVRSGHSLYNLGKPTEKKLYFARHQDSLPSFTQLAVKRPRLAASHLANLTRALLALYDGIYSAEKHKNVSLYRIHVDHGNGILIESAFSDLSNRTLHEIANNSPLESSVKATENHFKTLVEDWLEGCIFRASLLRKYLQG